MLSIKPPYSFLVATLNISPDVFIEEMVKCYVFSRWVDSMNAIIDKLTLVDVNMRSMREYNAETLDAWNGYVKKNKWDCWKSPNVCSLFEHIRGFGKECLTIEQDEPVFKIEKTQVWQSVSLHCGEDIFVTSIFATNNLDYNFSPLGFQWNYILRSDFNQLNNLIKQRKIVENHYHLWGSAPNIDLSWVYLMNHPYGQEKRFDTLLKKDTSFYGSIASYQETRQSNIYTLVKIAARIRVWLFQTCVMGEKSDDASEVFSKIKDVLYLGLDFESSEVDENIGLYRFNNGYEAYGTVVDYAIDANGVVLEKNNSYISGERRLYYSCLRHIYQYNDSDYRSGEVQALFYLYLLIKNRFGTIFIQLNEKTGFQNFKEFQDRKGILINKTPYQLMAGKMAITENIDENNLEQLEVRISPSNTPEELSESIKRIDDNIVGKSFELLRFDKQSDRTMSYFYVLHFLKGRKMVWNEKNELPICREFEKRRDFEKQAKSLRELRRKRLYGAFLIRGIDAASSEVNFRPECFGQAFRYLSNTKTDNESHSPMDRKPLPDLHKTYHVGEDFYDLIDGLRAIDEAVDFLELGNGDRIGHGVVMGLDVNEWYNRHKNIAIPVQNYLDNIAWILYKIREWNLNISTGLYEKLKEDFDHYFDILYYCNEQDQSKRIIPDLVAYIKAWRLRGDNPDCYATKEFDPEVMAKKSYTEWDRSAIRQKHSFKDLEKNPIVYKLIHRYHFDSQLKKLAQETMCYSAEPEFIELTKQLQIKMRNFVLEKGVAVESCPSSNFLISNLVELNEIPTFNLFPIRESHSDFIRLNVSINTDDQGVFFTSLQKEYAILAGTLREQRDSNGLRIHSDDKILNWIEHLINNGKQQCFKDLSDHQ